MQPKCACIVFFSYQDTDKDRAEALLEMLEKKGPFAYKAFKKALESGHEHLAEMLDETDMSKTFLQQGNIGMGL